MYVIIYIICRLEEEEAVLVTTAAAVVPAFSRSVTTPWLLCASIRDVLDGTIGRNQ